MSANLVHYLISYVVALLVFGLLAKWCIWPRIKDPPGCNSAASLSTSERGRDPSA